MAESRSGSPGADHADQRHATMHVLLRPRPELEHHILTILVDVLIEGIDDRARRAHAHAGPGLAEGDKDAWSHALGVATSMIGALTMARMVDDPKLASQILSEARSRLST